MAKCASKKTDGTEVTLPLARLSEADQEFAKSQAGPGESAEVEPYKQGDKVYLQVRGQWQLGEITEIKDGPGAAKFVVNLKTGDRRQLRAIEKRLRRYGKAGAGDVLLPGDVVEVKQGFDWVPGEVVSHDGRWAKVRIEGAVAEKSTPMSNLRVPGGVAAEANIGSVTVAKDKPQAKAAEPGMVYPPAPELTPVSLAGVRKISIPMTGPAESIHLGGPPAVIAADSLRSLPITLTPRRDIFDKVLSYSLAESGKLAVVLRGNHTAEEQMVELIDLTKEGKPLVVGLPPETQQVSLSPDGQRLVSVRHDYARSDVKLDAWKVTDKGLEHLASWSPQAPDDRWDKFLAVDWLNDQLLLCRTSKGAIAWDTATAAPSYQLPSGKVQTYGNKNKFLVFSDGKLGIAVVEATSGQLKGVVGRRQTMSGDLSISPSGETIMLSNNDGLIELWDLATGKKIIRTLLPEGVKGSGRWTESEAIVVFGWNNDLKACDLRTMQEVPVPEDQAGKPFRGYLWSATGESRGPFTFAAVPYQPEPVSGPATPSLDGPFIFSPGAGVAIDLQIDGSIEDQVRQSWLKEFEQSGVKLDDASRVKLVARTELGPSESKTYKSFFGEGEETVSYQTRRYISQLLVDGQVRIEKTWSDGLPMSLHPEKRESLQSHVDKQMKWESRYVPWIQLPEYIYDTSP